MQHYRKWLISSQRGRPLPNIASEPPTPVEYCENGNPNLDSDSATLDSQSNHTEEGVHPIMLETASEASVPSGLPLPSQGIRKNLMQSLGAVADLPEGHSVLQSKVAFASYVNSGHPLGIDPSMLRNSAGQVVLDMHARPVVIPRVPVHEAENAVLDISADDIEEEQEEKDQEEYGEQESQLPLEQRYCNHGDINDEGDPQKTGSQHNQHDMQVIDVNDTPV